MDTHRPRARASSALRAAVACLALAVPACGPGDGRAAVYPASGRVTYEGKPLAGALVVFKNADARPDVPSPTGTTGEDGSFRLRTYEPEDGAPEGQYLVAVSIAPPAHDGAGLLAGRSQAPPDVLKNRFVDPRTSGLKAAIRPGPNDLGAFDLK